MVENIDNTSLSSAVADSGTTSKALTAIYKSGNVPEVRYQPTEQEIKVENPYAVLSSSVDGAFVSYTDAVAGKQTAHDRVFGKGLVPTPEDAGIIPKQFAERMKMLKDLTVADYARSVGVKITQSKPASERVNAMNFNVSSGKQAGSDGVSLV